MKTQNPMSMREPGDRRIKCIRRTTCDFVNLDGSTDEDCVYYEVEFEDKTSTVGYDSPDELLAEWREQEKHMKADYWLPIETFRRSDHGEDASVLIWMGKWGAALVACEDMYEYVCDDCTHWMPVVGPSKGK